MGQIKNIKLHIVTDIKIPKASIGRADESNMNSTYLVKLRGLPWKVTAQEVVSFLGDCTIVGGLNGVRMINSPDGTFSGDAFVELASEADWQRARTHHNMNLGSRYIEVQDGNRAEMEWHLNYGMGASAGAPAGSNSGAAPAGDFFVKIRGVPYDVTIAHIMNFFSGFTIPPNGITVKTGPDGRASGDAFVEFTNQHDVERALKKTRERIAHRYIEVFRSSKQECLTGVSAGCNGQFPAARGTGRPRPGPYDRPGRGGGQFGSGGPPGGIPIIGGSSGGPPGLGGPPGGPPGLGGPPGGPLSSGGPPGPLDEPSKLSVNPSAGGGPGGGPPGSFNNGGMNNRGGRGGPGMGGGFRGRGGGFGGLGRLSNTVPIDYPTHIRGDSYVTHSGRPEETTTGFMIHMRGLPFRTNEDDIYKFFAPHQPCAVRILRADAGKPKGECDVDFKTHDEAKNAMEKNKQHIGKRYIELFLQCTDPPSSKNNETTSAVGQNGPPPSRNYSWDRPLGGNMPAYQMPQTTGGNIYF